MKKLIILCLIGIFTTSCTEKTEFGKCVGLAEDKDPTKIYNLSAYNIFWGIIGFELIFPPIDVLVNKIYCPVGSK